MAADTAGLQAAFKAAIDTAITESIAGTDQDDVRQNLADAQGQAVQDFIETVDILIPISGIVVVGSPTTQSNTVTLPIADALS